MRKCAVVGVGHWGQNLLRNFCALLGEARVIACDTDTKRLQTLQERHPHVQMVSDFSSVLSDTQIESVALATPAVTHFDLARQVLLAGKHAFVEKPITLHASEARELIQIAEQNGRVLMVDHLLEYHPAVERLRQLIEQGELGDLLYFYGQRLNLGIVRTEENALWSLASHDISVILYLLGEEPRRVCAHGARYLQEHIEDLSFVFLEFSSGVSAHLHVSWLDPHKTRKLVVVGSKKMAVFDDTASQKLLLYNKKVEREGGRFVPQDDGVCALDIESREPLSAVCAHFIECVMHNKRPRSDGYDGLRALRVLEAGQASLDQGGKPVELQEVLHP